MKYSALPEADPYGNFYFDKDHRVGPIIYISGRKDKVGQFFVIIDTEKGIETGKPDYSGDDFKYFETPQAAMLYINERVAQ